MTLSYPLASRVPRARLVVLLVVLLAPLAGSAAAPELREIVRTRVEAEYPSLEAMYRHLHANPELSFMEVKTAALIARELRALGFEVTEQVGNTGVVGVLKNGPGPTVLFRADMDALPIREQSGVPFASTAVVKDLAGREQPAMHACAHDTHITNLIGAARVLSSLQDRWSGTLVLVAQPAEEILAGARAMLVDGLYTRFPKPDFALALHSSAYQRAGMIGYGSGALMSGLSSVDVVVRGVSGHGGMPHTAKDPVVLAAQIVVALQTIVSREIKPGTPAVVSVGTIHGGQKRNVIPDEVKLELSVRAFDDRDMQHLLASIRRICDGTARAFGMSEERLPVVTETSERTEVLMNDAALTQRLAGVFTKWFGPERVEAVAPLTGAEDFASFGRTVDRVPICLWRVGATAPEKFAIAERTGVPPPAHHNSSYVPETEPTLKTGLTSIVAAVLELLPKR